MSQSTHCIVGFPWRSQCDNCEGLTYSRTHSCTDCSLCRSYRKRRCTPCERCIRRTMVRLESYSVLRCDAPGIPNTRKLLLAPTRLLNCKRVLLRVRRTWRASCAGRLDGSSSSSGQSSSTNLHCCCIASRIALTCTLASKPSEGCLVHHAEPSVPTVWLPIPLLGCRCVLGAERSRIPTSLPA